MVTLQQALVRMRLLGLRQSVLCCDVCVAVLLDGNGVDQGPARLVSDTACFCLRGPLKSDVLPSAYSKAYLMVDVDECIRVWM